MPEPIRHGGFRRTGLAQSREEHHSDGVKDGASQTSPGTKWTVKWKEALGLPECPYVYRWRFETPFGSIRVHHWLGRDDDRAMHDHPWWFFTFVIKGCYVEETPNGSKWLVAPTVRFRPAEYRHTVNPCVRGCWTVVITGPRVRHWGFWVKDKFMKANKYFGKYGHHPCD